MWGLQKNAFVCLSRLRRLTVWEHLARCFFFCSQKLPQNWDLEKSKQSLQKSEHNLQTICTSTMSAMSEQVTSNGKATTRSCTFATEPFTQSHSTHPCLSWSTKYSKIHVPSWDLYSTWHIVVAMDGFSRTRAPPHLLTPAAPECLYNNIMLKFTSSSLQNNVRWLLISTLTKKFVFETMPCPFGTKFYLWTAFSSSRNVFPCHSTSSGSCTQPNAFEIK